MDIDPSLVTSELAAQVAAVRVEPDPPPDFAAFWQETVSELQRVPLDLQVRWVDPPRSLADPALQFGIWSANSLGGRRILGPVVRPQAVPTGGFPQWVHGLRNPPEGCGSPFSNKEGLGCTTHVYSGWRKSWCTTRSL